MPASLKNPIAQKNWIKSHGVCPIKPTSCRVRSLKTKYLNMLTLQCKKLDFPVATFERTNTLAFCSGESICHLLMLDDTNNKCQLYVFTRTGFFLFFINFLSLFLSATVIIEGLASAKF